MDLRALPLLPVKTWVGKTQRHFGPLRTSPTGSGLGVGMLENQPVGLLAAGAF